MAEKIRIVIITGPTASGKSGLAMDLCERLSNSGGQTGEIINADSMQLYKGLDIGTAKPSKEEQERVPHHLIDIVSPDEDYTAALFREDASRAIEEISRRGARPFVVGGSGLYIRVLTKGLLKGPGEDSEFRARLTAEAEEKGGQVLYERLQAVDPLSATRIHPNNRVRIIRALEVSYLTGRPLSELQAEHSFAERPYETLKIAIKMTRKALYERIEERVDQMIKDGLVAEVEGLLKRGYREDLKPMQGLGYKEITAYIAGRRTLAEATRLIKKNTRNFAKRQLTWFRSDEDINWIEMDKCDRVELYEQIERAIAEHFA